MAIDQLKLAREMQKTQKELANEIVEVEAGDGVVVIRISADLKIRDVKIDPDFMTDHSVEDLEEMIKAAFADGFEKAQEIASQKLQPMMGKLGGLGF